jgi:hypothetical protein
LAEQMKEEAIKLTSGTVSTAQLRAMGHPFARRHPGSLARLPINRQSGGLQRSIRIMPRTVAGEEGFQLQFTSPHSKYVLRRMGTRKMVARGFWSEMKRRFRRLASKVKLVEKWESWQEKFQIPW